MIKSRLIEEDIDVQTKVHESLLSGFYGDEKSVKNKSACEYGIDYDMKVDRFMFNAKTQFENFTAMTQSYLELQEKYMIRDLNLMLKNISNFEDLSNLKIIN